MKLPLIESILPKGIRAPSADNLQPWLFRVIDDTHLELYLDPNRLGHFSDTAWAAPYFSCGAVIENLRIAAAALSYELNMTYLPDAENPAKAAEITFFPSSGLTPEPIEVIDKRCTNRKFYHPHKVVPKQVLNQMKSAVSRSGDFQLSTVERKDPLYCTLAQLVGDADQLRFEIRRLHEEFISLLRFEKGSADGLDVDSLEAGPGSRFFFKLMSKWERTEWMNRMGLSRLFNAYARRQILSSSGCALLSARKSDSIAELYMRAGEVSQRIWHEATKQGISVQPMEALPIFLLAVHHDPDHKKIMSQDQILKLEKYENQLRELFKISSSHEILFLFRFGYAPAPSMNSKRRSLESFMMKGSVDVSSQSRN